MNSARRTCGAPPVAEDRVVDSGDRTVGVVVRIEDEQGAFAEELPRGGQRFAQLDRSVREARAPRDPRADRKLAAEARQRRAAHVAGGHPSPPVRTPASASRRPRQFFPECASLIRQLKPCVLMSPQSVAQYLDPSQPLVRRRRLRRGLRRSRRTRPSVRSHAAGMSSSSGTRSSCHQRRSFSARSKARARSPTVKSSPSSTSILEECSASGLPSPATGVALPQPAPVADLFSNARYYGSRLEVFPAAHARPANLGVSVELVKARSTIAVAPRRTRARRRPSSATWCDVSAIKGEPAKPRRGHVLACAAGARRRSARGGA